MKFKFFVIFVILTIGSVFLFPQNAVGEEEFTRGEIDEMKNTAVLITMEEGTFMIELLKLNHLLEILEVGQKFVLIQKILLLIQLEHALV